MYLEDGSYLGSHKGYPYYTIGQRKGLGISLGYPAYVKSIDKINNSIIIGTLKEIEKQAFRVTKLNILKYPSLSNKKYEVDIKIRYNMKSELGEIKKNR